MRQITTRRTLAGAVLLAAAAASAGCAADAERGALEVEVQVEVCVAECVLLPAAGAAVEVVDGSGQVVASDEVALDGRAVFEVEPGRYGVTVSDTRLALELTVDPADGDAVAADGVTTRSIVLGTLRTR